MFGRIDCELVTEAAAPEAAPGSGKGGKGGAGKGKGSKKGGANPPVATLQTAATRSDL